MDSASVWTPGIRLVPLVNAQSTLIPQYFVGAAGQTVFNITAFQYVVNVGSVLVFINGVLQSTGRDYTETSPTRITLLEGVDDGDLVVVMGFVGTIVTGSSGSAGVSSFNTRVGAVDLTSDDVIGALGYVPSAGTSGVNTFNSRTGIVTLTSSDVTGALTYVPGSLSGANTWAGINTFNLSPLVPTATPGDSSTKSASTAFVAAAISGGGSGNFTQLGTGAVTVSMQTKVREFLNAADFGVTMNGTTDDSAAFLLAMNAAAAQGRILYLSPGTMKCGPIVVPSGFLGLIGDSPSNTTIKIIPGTYATGAMFYAPTFIGLTLENFSFNVDDPAFIGYLAIDVAGSSNMLIDNVYVKGQGSTGIRIDDCFNSTINRCQIIVTGSVQTVSWGMGVGIYGQRVSNVNISNCTITGLPGYAIALGIGSVKCKIYKCYTDGTTGAPSGSGGGGFGFSFGGCGQCIIEGCTVFDSQYEAYQLTDCLECTITGNNAYWTETGTHAKSHDIGISIAAATGQLTRLCLITNNILVNSYAAGLVAAGNVSYCTFSNNVLLNCGVRQYTVDPGANSGMGQYNDFSGATLYNNIFKNNLILNEVGNTNFGYHENNTGGSTVTGTILDGNVFRGTLTTAKYSLISVATSYVQDETQVANYVSAGLLAADGSGYIKFYNPTANTTKTVHVNNSGFFSVLNAAESTELLTIDNSGNGIFTQKVTASNFNQPSSHWTPLLTTNSGGPLTYTVLLASANVTGKMVFFTAYFSVTALGGASGQLIVTIPTTTTSNAVGCAQGAATGGKFLAGIVGASSTLVSFLNPDGTSPWGAGTGLYQVSGWYEQA